MLNGNRTKSNRGRSPRDLYITPPELANAAMVKFSLDKYPHSYFDFGLDAGCGSGIWGKVATNLIALVDGIDLVPNVSDRDINQFRMVYAGDFLDFGIKYYVRYNVIFGNPPYSLAEEFIRRSFELLEDDGYIYFLLRLSFLEGMARGKGLFKEFPIKRVYVCSRRPSFFSTNGKHTTDTLAYAMFLWQKGYTGETELDWLDWDYK